MSLPRNETFSQSRDSSIRYTSTNRPIHSIKALISRIQNIFCDEKTRDLLIVLTQVFLSELPRGIILPTLIPYITSTGTSNPQFLSSMAISAFSVGRLVSSYPLGLLADKCGSSRLSLMLGTLMVIIFNTVFAFAGFLPSSIAAWVIVIARFFVGFGSGTLGVARAYMARISTKKERLKYVMYNTLLQYIGFSISPIISELVSAVLLPKKSSSAVALGLIPGLTTTFMSVGMMFLLLLMRRMDPEPEEDDFEFPGEAKPDYMSSKGVDIAKESKLATEDAAKAQEKKEKYHEKKLMACFMLYLFLNFSLRGILSILETFGAEEFQRILSPRKTPSLDIIRDSGRFFVGMGCVGVGVLLLLPRIAKRFTPYNCLLFGIGCMIVGTSLFTSIVFQPKLVLFTIAVLLIWSFGSPITQTLTISTYSQMMGSKPQGSAMGWLTTAGSLGRILFPLIGGASFTAIGYINFFASLISLMAVIGFRLLFGLEN